MIQYAGIYDALRLALGFHLAYTLREIQWQILPHMILQSSSSCIGLVQTLMYWIPMKLDEKYSIYFLLIRSCLHHSECLMGNYYYHHHHHYYRHHYSIFYNASGCGTLDDKAYIHGILRDVDSWTTLHTYTSYPQIVANSHEEPPVRWNVCFVIWNIGWHNKSLRQTLCIPIIWLSSLNKGRWILLILFIKLLLILSAVARVGLHVWNTIL